ncbi:hypothetical protein JD793_004939 [Citrobacter braakii]|nr:hypothetical protein [Citrobacter braakii]
MKNKQVSQQWLPLVFQLTYAYEGVKKSKYWQVSQPQPKKAIGRKLLDSVEKQDVPGKEAYNK